jgi:hypothetical protein
MLANSIFQAHISDKRGHRLEQLGVGGGTAYGIPSSSIIELDYFFDLFFQDSVKTSV